MWCVVFVKFIGESNIIAKIVDKVLVLIFYYNFYLKLKPDEVAVSLNGISNRLNEYLGKQSLFVSRLQFHSIKI